MDELARVFNYDWRSFNFAVDSVRMLDLSAHVLKRVNEGERSDYPDRLRTMRMVLASNDRFQELTPYRMFGPHRYNWVDVLFMCECVVDRSECENTFHDRVYTADMFPNLFGHLLAKDPAAMVDVSVYTAQETLDALEKITWTMTDVQIPKTAEYRNELATFFELILRRAKLFIGKPCSSLEVEFEYECDLEKIKDEMLKSRGLNETAMVMPVRDPIDDIIERTKKVDRTTEVNVMFVHRINVAASWIEREIVETSLIESRFSSSPACEEALQRVLKCLTDRAVVTFDNPIMFKRLYTAFMHTRRIVDCDRLVFNYLNGRGEFRKPIEYLNAKSNKDWITTLGSFDFNSVHAHDPRTVEDLLMRYWTNMEFTCGYDELLSEPSSLAWWNRRKGNKVFRCNLHDAWFFAGDWSRPHFETFDSVAHFYVSMITRNLLPTFLLDPKQMNRRINMSGFKTVLGLP